MKTSPISPFVEQMLNVTSKRQQALSANLANMDTPGYTATDFSFQSELSSIQLEATDQKHLQLPGGGAGVRQYEVGTPTKTNGNNVDLDREMTELTKNGIQYATLIEFLNHKLRTLRSSLTEGGRG